MLEYRLSDTQTQSILKRNNFEFQEVMKMKKILALLISGMMLLAAVLYGFAEETMSDTMYIESVLNLANNPDQE